MKGNIVFFAIDALGHIHPLLGIARELIARNYRVSILTVRRLQNTEKYKGIEFHSCIEDEKANQVTRDDDPSINMAVMAPLKTLFRQGIKKSFEATYALEGACGKHALDVIEKHDLVEAKLRSLNPDLVVVDYIVGIPCATYVSPKWVRLYSGFPSVMYSDRNHNFSAGRGLKLEEMTVEEKEFEIKTKSVMVKRMKEFFAKKGLPVWEGDIELAPSSPYLNFCLGPDELSLDRVPKLKPMDNSWFRLEHTIDEPESGSRFDIPVQLKSLPGKLIYFSLGTLVTADTELINRLLGMLSKSPNKFIVSKGQMHEHIKMYPNMWGDKFLDQKAILPKVDLFITHGGHNSIIEAFYYGVPGLIVLPVFADQFDSAQRIEDCGFGIRLNPFECKEEELLSSIDSLLSDEDLKTKMKLIGSRLRSIEYHKIAADHVERLLAKS